jgi:hypothetical protein
MPALAQVRGEYPSHTAAAEKKSARVAHDPLLYGAMMTARGCQSKGACGCDGATKSTGRNKPAPPPTSRKRRRKKNTANGEWKEQRIANREWQMANGERRRVASSEWRAGKKQRMANSEWRMANGEWCDARRVTIARSRFVRSV